MVERARRPVRMAAIAAVAALASGCGLVPKARLEDCHKLSRGLQTEMAQLKDETLRLRAHNQDLAQRAVDDARQIRALEEAHDRLERSVQAYQDQRDKLEAAFERFKHQIAASADRSPTALLDRFGDFARAHPGCTFDARAAVSAFPCDLLFRPGGAEWAPGAEALLRDYAALLADPGARSLSPCVLADAADSPIRRTGGGTGPEGARGVALERAGRVRDALADLAGLDAARLGTADAADGPGRTIEIHLRPAAEAPEGASRPDAGDVPDGEA